MGVNKTCTKCGSCCKCLTGPFVFPSDVVKISKNIGVTTRDFLSLYCVSHYITCYDKKVLVFCLKVIDERCVFLTTNNLCRIYSYRPFQCIYAPYDFLSNFSDFWEHMSCLDKQKLITCNSEKNDIEKFSELINPGYGHLI